MGYSLFEFGADTTHADASEFRNVQRNDYRRIGISDSDAKKMAFHEDGRGVESMLAALRNGEPRYFGLKDGNSLAAVACLSDWLYGDAAPYQPEIITRLAKLRHRIGSRLGVNAVRDSGLAAFGVVDDRFYQEEAAELLDYVMEEANGKQSRYLYAAADTQDDEFIEAFNNKGAKMAKGKIELVDVHGVERLYGLMRAEVR